MEPQPQRRSPAGDELFDLLEQAGENIERAATLLERMLRDYPERRELASEILACERRGDRITHDAIHRLHGGPSDPIDRSDAYRLVSTLDDVVDYIEEVSDYLGLYQIEAPMAQAQAQAGILLSATQALRRAIGRLRTMGGVGSERAAINRLENDGDRIVREAIASLFAPGIDPIVVIRWKDLFERLEEAIDACERAANLLDGIVIKHS